MPEAKAAKAKAAAAPPSAVLLLAGPRSGPAAAAKAAAAVAFAALLAATTLYWQGRHGLLPLGAAVRGGFSRPALARAAGAAKNKEEGRPRTGGPGGEERRQRPRRRPGSCSALLSRLGVGPGAGPGPSRAWWWTELRGRVLNASYYPREAEHPGFEEWATAAFSFYTPARLRRSASHPASPGGARRLLDLVLAGGERGGGGGGEEEEEGDDDQYGPIRVLVMGGSVTFGAQCDVNTEVPGLPPPPPRPPPPGGSAAAAAANECAWPARLEKMLDAIFSPPPPPEGGGGGGRPLFRVTNGAIRGTNSQFGASLLRSHLVDGLDGAGGEGRRRPPHVVVSAYATNDACDPDRDGSSHNYQQDFVRAALALGGCGEGGGGPRGGKSGGPPPVVVLVDDMHGARWGKTGEPDALEVSGKLYKVASWFGVMMVSYGNVARRAALAQYDGTGKPFALFASDFTSVHLGMGFHLGVAWTVLYNLLSALVDAACEDAGDEGEGWEEEEEEEGGGAPGAHGDRWAGRPPGASLAREPPSAGLLGPIEDMGLAGPRWRERIREKRAECSTPSPPAETEAAARSPDGERAPPPPPPRPYSNDKCSYAWVANPVSLYTAGAVEDALRPVLVSRSGWTVLNSQKGASPSLAARSPNATFSVAVRNVTVPTRYLTVYAKTCNLPLYANSTLAVTARVERRSPPPAEGGDEEDDAALTATYETTGYHTTPASIYLPSKFRLPGPDGARVGDTVHAEFRLVSGRAITLVGLAFCRD